MESGYLCTGHSHLRHDWEGTDQPLAVPMPIPKRTAHTVPLFVLHIRIHTMLKKEPNNSHPSKVRGSTMQRCPIVDVQGVRIYAEPEQKPGNLFSHRYM